MFILVIIAFFGAFALFPAFRCFIFNPISTIYYLFKDIYFYFKHKKYNECKDYGKIIDVTALFGGGKTLSSTMYVRRIYKKYNGKLVWNEQTQQFDKQIIKVLSNVDFKDIPYIKLKCADDIIHINDNEPITTVAIVLIDEASTQFNSRNFKTNLPTELLNQILTCRHHKIGIVLTNQRFGHLDALLRQCTSIDKECKLKWRFLRINYFDAWDLENCNNPSALVPIKRTCLFVRDKDFNAYDTYAIVDNFIHSVEKGEILTDDELLKYKSPIENDLTNVNKLSSKFKRRIKKFGI